MLDLEIRERLGRYVAGEITRSEFEDWFFAETWDVERDGTPWTRRLTFAIMRLLAERSNGDWSEAEVKERLRPLAETYWLDVTNPDVSLSTAAQVIEETRSKVIRPARRAVAGRSRAKVSA